MNFINKKIIILTSILVVYLVLFYFFYRLSHFKLGISKINREVKRIEKLNKSLIAKPSLKNNLKDTTFTFFPFIKYKDKDLIYDKNPSYLLPKGEIISPWTNEKVVYQEDIDLLKYKQFLVEDKDKGGLNNGLELKLNLDVDDSSDDNLDFDGDGFLNLEELKEGTDLANKKSHPSLFRFLKLNNVYVSFVPFLFKNIIVNNINDKLQWDISLQILKNKKFYFVRKSETIDLVNLAFFIKDIFFDRDNKENNYILVDVIEKKTSKIIQRIKMFANKKSLLLYKFKVNLENSLEPVETFTIESLEQIFSINIYGNKESFKLAKILSLSEIEVLSLKNQKKYRIKKSL